MATRSTISFYSKDNDEIHTIYCHWDGYLSNNGKILVEHYQDKNKILGLIALGNISKLDKDIDLVEGHSFDNPVNGHVVAYCRDRGESWEHCKAKTYTSIDDMLKNEQQSFNYIYYEDLSRWGVIYDDEEQAVVDTDLDGLLIKRNILKT